MSRRDREQKANDYLRRAPNYVAEALPDLEQALEWHRKKGHSQDVETLDLLIRSLPRAAKFVLPNDGLLFDEVKPWMFENIHPPFDLCVFEFTLSEEHGRILSSGGDIASDKESRMDRMLILSVCVESITVLINVGHSARNGWKTGVFFPMVDRNRTRVYNRKSAPGDLLILDTTAVENPSDTDVIIANVSFHRIASTAEKLQKGLGLTKEEIEKRAALSTRPLMAIFAQACAALECTNVGTEVLRPNREAIKARAPLDSYEYHVLTIEPNEERVPSQERGGHHASPRTHLRRGHIRHLSSGKKVWVNSCLVNPGHGMIEKDYVLA